MKERYELHESNKNFIEIFDSEIDMWITEDSICERLNNYDKEMKELVQEQVEEMQEHQKAMLIADKAIKDERKRVVDEIIAQLSRIEDTLINCGSGKEDALAYFLEILKNIKGEE